MSAIVRPRELASLVLAGLLVVLMVTTDGGSASAVGPASGGEGAFSKTRTITRVLAATPAPEETSPSPTDPTDDDPTAEPTDDPTDDTPQDVVDSRQFTLTVDHTLNLRGRERVKIDWSGAHPSGARAANPYGENGLNQEYPVVIMQCRGIDDPSLPEAQRLKPETCWTSTRQQRSQSTDAVLGVWRHDLKATKADRELKSGLTDLPKECVDTKSDATHTTPFVAANGKVYAACSADTMPPEAAVGAALPPAEVSAYSDADGKGSVNFEVRSSAENESLGCSDKVPCSIVAVPIMGISCYDDNYDCRREGRFEAGSSNFANEGVVPAVSPLYWWSASNWDNRVSVPLTFGLPPDACAVLDKRPPTAFYGSELMNQASLQWAPAYCLNQQRFKFQHNRMGDDPAFVLVENGQAPAAFVSGAREAESTTERIGYAPTAVTGFAVGFTIDEPGNAGERQQLNLNARLIAKLLTQSYTGSSRGQQHPGMEANPMSLNVDPEFNALNPGLDRIQREAAATVLSLSESSDVISSLTSYLNADPEAKQFIKGARDPWGMVVNPSYKGLKLPVSEFPLRDTFVPTSGLECYQQNPAPYFSQLAAPVNSITKIASALLDAWPNVQTKCDRASASDPFKVGRIDRQGVGTRFMLGIVSLGDADRYGLRTASLQTASSVGPSSPFIDGSGRTFVAPTTSSISAAVKLAKDKGSRSAFQMTQDMLRKQPAAYPGTMIVYTTAKIRGLDKEDAAKVSAFIKIATSEGQVPGSGNGKLPGGFLPIVKTGATAKLWASAQRVATLVAAQKEAAAKPEATKGAPKPAPAAPAAAPVDAPQDDAPAAAAGEGAATATDDIVATSAQSSGAAGALFPVLIALALLAGLGGPATRVVHLWRNR
ncbi:MAG: hypothetical protein ABWY58_13915 [Aeromicrobium sp.]